MTETRIRQETYDLSGMGGGYEDMCQRMLWRGVGFLAERNPPVEMWDGATEYADFYGLMSTTGGDLKALEMAIIKPADDVTGAMHQCVMGHLRFIHRNGIDKWRSEIDGARTEGPFTWEGDL